MKLFMIVITLVGFNAFAAKSGYVQRQIMNKKAVFNLMNENTTLECTQTNLWQQSEMTMLSKVVTDFSTLGAKKLINYIDGDCEPLKHYLEQEMERALVVQATIDLKEILEWGIVNEGTQYEKRYCEEYFYEVLHANDFQATTKKVIKNIDYKECVKNQ